MGERIKKLRKTFDFTQQEFADRIGIKQNTIAKYETGRGNPTVSVVSLICREFNVNETWLRTGEGEMFNETAASALDRLCTEMRATELEREIMSAYFEIDATIRGAFISEMVAKIRGSAKPAPQPSEPDVAAMFMELKRENAELRKRLETIEQEDAYMEELSSALFSSPESSANKKPGGN